MQTKFGTVLDNKILLKTRQFCKKEHIPISKFLEEALSEYLLKKDQILPKLSTIDSSFGVLKISEKSLKTVMEEDVYEID